MLSQKHDKFLFFFFSYTSVTEVSFTYFSKSTSKLMSNSSSRDINQSWSEGTPTTSWRRGCEKPGTYNLFSEVSSATGAEAPPTIWRLTCDSDSHSILQLIKN